MRAMRIVPVLLVGLLLAAGVPALAEDRVGEPPRWKRLLLPDAEQDVFYSFNLTVTDEDHDLEELTLTDDADFFEISPSGEIAFVPRNEHVGTNWFNVTATDPEGLSDTMELKLFVIGHSPPRLPYIRPLCAHEDQVFILNLTEYVYDEGHPNPLDGYTFSDDSEKIETDPETGVIIWDRPTNGDVGDHYFKVTVKGDEGRYAEQEIKITVINTNDAPVIEHAPRQELTQDQPYEMYLPVHDDDLDALGVEEVLRFSNEPRDLFTIHPETGRIRLTPNNSQVGVWEVNVFVVDSEGAMDVATVQFRVRNVNDDPTFEGFTTYHELLEDEPFTLQLLARDADLEPRDAEPGTRVDPDERLWFSGGLGSHTVDPETGAFTLTPTDDDAKVGTCNVLFTVRDASGGMDTIEVTLRIIDVFDPPPDMHIAMAREGSRVRMIPNQTFRHGEAYKLMAVSEHNPDEPWGDAFFWYGNGQPIGTGREITWTPKTKGTTTLLLVVSDGDGNEASCSIDVEVRHVDTGPSILAKWAGAVLAAALLFALAYVVMRSVRERARGRA